MANDTVSGTTRLPFDDIEWEMHEGRTIHLHGMIEVEYTYDKYIDGGWTLDGLEADFIQLEATDSEGSPVELNSIDARRATVFLMGHSKLNDYIDEKVYDDFNNR
jgi:hypothetical protein